MNTIELEKLIFNSLRKGGYFQEDTNIKQLEKENIIPPWRWQATAVNSPKSAKYSWAAATSKWQKIAKKTPTIFFCLDASSRRETTDNILTITLIPSHLFGIDTTKGEDSLKSLARCQG
ncbi:MAG: hypothetical protein NZ901_00505 [Geminocystis sp.]|nr:hypothetical protein [Geminocystis sp.]HIK38256.1 hypothetical protein [Geminocystis sp. M7585_C2015_104]MCS7146649.1 hypothetical protein [Geminocystis sp.]MCX8077202.1 hypothetical protein [Geminocystis sp.]MDW8115475.1 hypothetical protein [Geminocystis sp.]